MPALALIMCFLSGYNGVNWALRLFHLSCGVIRQDPLECCYRPSFAVNYGGIEMSPIVPPGQLL